MAADSMASARRVPLIASVPKMLFPFLVILPGLIALALMNPVIQNAASPDQPNQSVQPVEIQPDKQGMIPPETNPETGEVVKDKSGKVVLDYNMVIPNMLLHYFPSGMLGLGLTALLASFMSGMARNVTAFNTLWTYDIFKAYIRRDATDANLLLVGQLATFFGVALSVAVAYFVAAFNNIMDVLQLVFAFVNAPRYRVRGERSDRNCIRRNP
jgi:solute:Na+ symporter, SSS family